MIIKPWVSRPPRGVRLNLDHPLCKGMVGCWHLDYGLPYDLVSGTYMTQTGVPGLAIGDGPARTFLNDDSQYFQVPGDNVQTSPYNIGTDISVLVTHYEKDNGSGIALQPVSRIDFSNMGWNIQWFNTSSGGLLDWTLEYVRQSDSSFQSPNWFCRRQSAINHVVVTGSSSNSKLFLYANGLTGYANSGADTSAFTGGILTTSGGTQRALTIGTLSNIGSALRGCTNPLSRIIIWNRALTPGEGLSITNPQTAYAYMMPMQMFVQGPQGDTLFAQSVF